VGQAHSERLLPLIQEILDSAGWTYADLDAVAFGAGPGSFTGLRIACAVAQGLGLALQRPLIPIGNLTAVATAAAVAAPAARRILAVLDARMQQAYVAAFVVPAGVTESWQILYAPALVAPTELEPLVARLKIDCVAGPGLGVFAQQLTPVSGVDYLPAVVASAAVIARCAQVEWAAQRTVPPAAAAPLYVRNEVALTVAQRAAQAAV
jgi:tRNA threonylcarbamoyladenosine biosynthesis protein TsaB